MNEYKTHFDTPEDAYFGFFEADASQNGDAWAAVMSYPHVRVDASGRTAYYDTARDYADNADWTSRVATGLGPDEGARPRPAARISQQGPSGRRVDAIQCRRRSHPVEPRHLYCHQTR